MALLFQLLWFHPILFLLLMIEAWTDAVQDRNRAGCTLLGFDIHCYGGGKSGASFSWTIFDEHMALDLKGSFRVNQPVNAWENMPVLPVPEPTGRRWGHNLLTTNNDSAMVLLQGSDNGDVSSQVKNTTYVYYPRNGTWAYIPTDKSVIPDTFAGSAEVDSNDIIYLWGGIVSLDNQSVELNGFYNSHLNDTRVMLPSALYTLNTLTWKWNVLPVNTSLIPIRADHSSAMTDDDKLYIVAGIGIANGGDQDQNGNRTRYYSDMMDIVVYDTVKQTWSTIRANGDPPSPRRAASLTNAAGRGMLILYGGIYDTGGKGQSPGKKKKDADLLFFPISGASERANGRAPVFDVCYKFNISTSTWQNVNLSITANDKNALGAGQVYGHNAVMYGTDLFILFGVDESNSYRADVNVLDTISWTWKDSYNLTEFWTPGMIAGIALAIVAVILLFASFVYCCYRRMQAEIRAMEHKASVPKNDFIMEPPDPRSGMEDHAFYHGPPMTPTEVEHLQVGGTPPVPVGAGIVRPMSSGSYFMPQQQHPSARDNAEQRQQWLAERPMSTSALGTLRRPSSPMETNGGGEYGNGGLPGTLRPQSSLSQCVTESTFTSFSGTTKPDEGMPASPTYPTTPTFQKVKPDGPD
ncbi:hypothetical protein BC940DRAFT_128000 [Gongronella butleri]|nr:hypothetical protein BC940DRAFT_128000 [Gongronella butleri]